MLVIQVEALGTYFIFCLNLSNLLNSETRKSQLTVDEHMSSEKADSSISTKKREAQDTRSCFLESLVLSQAKGTITALLRTEFILTQPRLEHGARIRPRTNIACEALEHRVGVVGKPIVPVRCCRCAVVRACLAGMQQERQRPGKEEVGRKLLAEVVCWWR